MNNSSYCCYNQHIIYEFHNTLYSIPIFIYPEINIQTLDIITYAPKQYKEYIDPVYASTEELSLISLLNKDRPGIYNPHQIFMEVAAPITKNSRLGIFNSASQNNNRKLVFTRGLKNVG